jgi:hypothetical protein
VITAEQVAVEPVADPVDRPAGGSAAATGCPHEVVDQPPKRTMPRTTDARRDGDVRRQPLPHLEAAIAELGHIPEPSQASPESSPQRLSGGPGQVHAMLEAMADEIATEEIVI